MILFLRNLDVFAKCSKKKNRESPQYKQNAAWRRDGKPPMVRSMNRIDRMLATILLLQSRRVTKAEDIAGYFEISLRTVYRDIAALGEAGVPIVAEAGVGYGLLKGYSVPPVMFTAEEAGALFLGGEMVGRLTDPSLQSPVSSALLKIRSVLPRAQQDHLDRLEKATALFVPSRKTRQAPQAVLAQIQRALAQRRVLSIDYLAAGREESTPRDVEPLGLIYYSDRWHLIAYCRLRQDYRDFRTDRMQDLRVRNVAFAGHEGFSVQEYVSSRCESSGQFEVRLLFSARAADRARRSWLAEWISETGTEEGTLISFAAEDLEWLAFWLLSFGTEVEVLGPPELRSRLSECAGALARHHAPKPGQETEKNPGTKKAADIGLSGGSVKVPSSFARNSPGKKETQNYYDKKRRNQLV